MKITATSVESNAQRRTRDEVRSLKAEQCSPKQEDDHVILSLSKETPAEGAAKRYDLWPHARDERDRPLGRHVPKRTKFAMSWCRFL